MKNHKEGIKKKKENNEDSQGNITRKYHKEGLMKNHKEQPQGKLMKNHQDAQKAPGKDNKITTWMFPVKNDNKEEDKERKR